MNDMRLEPGTILAEKYRLESVLGVGGMGTVYRAEHLALKAPVAIKVIDREVTEGDVALTRFMNEAQAAASLRSPHVVQILDYGTDGDRPFMVMEMLEGESLADRIDRVGRLTPQETYLVISHVAKAVAKAHEADIIHRDLKPDNVFLVHNEGDEIAKVLDFGVAKVEATQLDGEGHTRTGSLLGTPYYMSPEQAQGNKDIDARSDLWALGVIACECLTGKRPFSSDGLGDLVLQICIRDIPRPSDTAQVPPDFDEWFFQACQRELEDRFQTARELSEALRSALGLGGETGSIPESRWSAAAAPEASLRQAKKTKNDGAPSSAPGQTPSTADTKDERETEVDKEPARPPLTSETLLEGTTPGVDPTARGSKWEVVPHHEKDQSALEPVAQEETTSSSGGSSVFVVAISALLLGGAVVFGIKQAGIDVGGKQAPNQPRLTPPPAAAKGEKPGATLPPAPNSGSSAQIAATKTQPATSEEPDPDATVPEGEDAPEEEVVDPSEGPDEETSPVDETPVEEDKLQQIEDAAKAAIAERTGQGEEKPTKDEPDPPKESSGPQPTLPEGLAPAPAPPPPTK